MHKSNQDPCQTRDEVTQLCCVSDMGLSQHVLTLEPFQNRWKCRSGVAPFSPPSLRGLDKNSVDDTAVELQLHRLELLFQRHSPEDATKTVLVD